MPNLRRLWRLSGLPRTGRSTMKTLLLAILLVLCCSAVAQTTSTALPSGGCRSIQNCILYNPDGSEAVWVSMDFVQTPETGNCYTVTSRNYVSDGKNPRTQGHSQFQFSVSCQGDGFTISVQESGYAYYTPGGGGRGGGGAGVAYHIDSGTRTITR